MKRLTYLLSIFFTSMMFIQCTEEETVNRPPESFQLTEENFTVMYNKDNETVSIDWPNVRDADGDPVTYDVRVNDQQKAAGLKVSNAEIAASEFEDLMGKHTFEIIASDPKKASSKATAERTPFPNESPGKPQTVQAKPAFYGAQLSWEAATDPDQNKVFYSIEIGGTVVAEGIEGNSFIVRGYAEETTHTATLKAVDEFGAESEGETLEFTTLKKKEIPMADERGTVKVWGVVVNETGTIIADATVKIGDSEQQTNERGLFLFEDINVSLSRELLTVTAPNYFKSFRTLKVEDGAASYQRIEMLPKKVAGTINADEGGKVTSDQNVSIELPQDAFEGYNGEVTVSTRRMDPTDEDFGFQNPGLEAFNTEGDYGALRSFGMTAVELQNANGEELQLKAGKQATITVPVPEALGQYAPEVIPLWSFDEEQNIWIEEGQAELKDGMYVGKVGHFSLWNHDDFRQGREVCYTVQDADGNPLANTYIEIILENGMVGSGNTNENGIVCTFMPAGVKYTINLTAYNSFGFGGSSSSRQCNIITGQEGPGVPFGTTRISRIVKAEGGQELYLSVEGDVQDCDNKPLKNSLVVVRDKDNNIILTSFSDADGKFRMKGWNCFAYDGNGSNKIEVMAYDMLNDKYSKPKEFSVASNRIIAKEPFVVCQDSIPGFGESGNVYVGDLKIRSNKDVTDFIANGYTGVDGSIDIWGPEDVTDISALQRRLTKVTGNIFIINTALKDLTGLTGIEDFDGDLLVFANKKLTDVTLPNIKTVSKFQINGNSLLKTINVSNLERMVVRIEKGKETPSYFVVRNNPVLTEFLYNPNLTIPESSSFDLRLDDNEALAGAGEFAFNTIKKGYNIVIDDVKRISFPNLEYAEYLSIGSLDLAEFPRLTKINGPLHVNQVVGVNLSNLEEVKGDVSFNNYANVEVTELPTEILNLSKLRTIDGKFDMDIRNSQVHSAITEIDLSSLESATNIDIRRTKITHLDLPKLKKVGVFQIGFNGELLTFGKFESLTSVSSFLISRNDKLQRIDGFNNVKNISIYFTIIFNDRLASISGLNALESIGQYVKITSNSELRGYCGIPKTVWDPNGSIKTFVLSNPKPTGEEYKNRPDPYNPTQQDLFEGRCSN